MALSTNIAAATLGAMLFAGPAISQTSAVSSRPAVAAATISSSDYVRQTAMSDLFEIQSSQMALDKSQDAAVRKFAQQMIHDHTQSSEKLKKLLQTENVNIAPPSKLDQAHLALLDKLRGASGSAFDKDYVKDQIAGHREALAVQKTYAASGEDAKLKSFAQAAADMVQMHLDEAEKLGQGGST